MRLHKISEKGELIKIDKLIFEEVDVYLVDDEEKNTIYIWVGLKVPQEKKDITADIARKLDKERGGSTKILIMKERREYGSFLAMMHNLEKGLIPGVSVERRPEFVFEVRPESIKSIKLDGTPEEREIKVETRIGEWLQQIKEHRKIKPKQMEEKVTKAVKFIRLEKVPAKVEPKDTIPIEKITPKEEVIEEADFKTQIREAAYYLSQKKQRRSESDSSSIEYIKRKAEEVFLSSCSYDELAWLNAEMDHLIKKSYLEEKKKKSYY